MNSSHNLREQIQPLPVLVILVLVGIATYFEFVYYSPTSIYMIMVWIIAVPLLLLATIGDIRDHKIFRFFSYSAIILVGVLQYADNQQWYLAASFVVIGTIGILHEIRG